MNLPFLPNIGPKKCVAFGVKNFFHSKNNSLFSASISMPNCHPPIYDFTSFTCSRLPPNTRSTSSANFSYFLLCLETQAKAAQTLILSEGTSPSWKVQQESGFCFLWSTERAVGAPGQWEEDPDGFKSVSILDKRNMEET